MTNLNSVNEREILEFWDGWRYDMQLLNPAMNAKEIKSTGLSKYSFIRTYVQACFKPRAPRRSPACFRHSAIWSASF